MSGTFPSKVRAADFWRVNSYGYPCFFTSSVNSQEAWATLLSFYDFTEYDALKAYWSSSAAPRQLSPQGVESWKATFEEFGLLYVLTGSNRITITEAGVQLRDAADRDDRAEFAWIGLNLLLRYPLKGPRRPKSESHASSNLLLYRFWYSALLDLDGYIWWSEIERILCRVFETNDALGAIEDVRVLRSNPELIDRIALPVARREGAFYNSLNQVVVHASMNYLLLNKDDHMQCPYGPTEPKRRHSIKDDWAGMIRSALPGGDLNQCASGGTAASRLAAAPTLVGESDYFAYLGSKVVSLSAAASESLTSLEIMGDKGFFLTEGTSYEIGGEYEIRGPVAYLCQLARGQRVVLSHDERWTYTVQAKELISTGLVRVSLRRSLPISSMGAVRTMRGEQNA